MRKKRISAKMGFTQHIVMRLDKAMEEVNDEPEYFRLTLFKR